MPAPPALRRCSHRVSTVELGPQTAYAGGRLTVSEGHAAGLLADPALASARVSAVAPGESARLVKVLDAVEPRTKGRGGAGIFPGLLGPALPQGGGETHVLAGMAVVVAGHLPRAQEGLVDMSGPAAPLSFLSSLHNLVVEFAPAPGARFEDVDAALRRGSLRLAATLAEAALDSEPDEVEELAELTPAAGLSRDLPRVGTITNLQTQGAFKDVLVYGRSFTGGLPAPIDPTEMEDGAVVSGQYGHPALKNPTYVFQNHPVVTALRRRDGTDLRLAGLVLCPEPVEQDRKVLVAVHAARLCRSLGLDAVIVTKEGGGNADADVSLKMDALEELGIAAVGIFGEMSGSDGSGPPLVAPPERATLMVSTGNYDERLRLPAVERALGGVRLDVSDAPATGEIEVPAAIVYGSLNPLGAGRLTASEAA